MLIEFLIALEALTRLLESVPVVFYAATIASFMTLTGMWLQSRAESKRNLERLTHDALQRDRERDMALRREVYLRAAEAMAQAQEYLSGFANPAISPQQHEAMIKGVGADLNKVHIVASLSTVKAVVEANQFFVRAVADLSVKKRPIEALMHEIEREQRVIESAEARRDEALTTMKEMNRSATGTRPLWDTQSRVFHDEQNDIDGALARKERLQQRLASKQSELARLCAKAGLEFGRRVVNANLAIRRELELPLDAQDYLSLMQRSHDTLGHEVDEFHRRITAQAATESDVAEPRSGGRAAPAARHHAMRRYSAVAQVAQTPNA